MKFWNYYGFWSDCKENSYQLQNVLENSSFSTKGVNYNEEKFSWWKLSVYLNLENLLYLGDTYWTCNYNKTLNFQIFPKIQSGVKTRLGKLHFIRYAQMQWNSFSWPKFSLSKTSKKFHNTLLGEPFLRVFCSWDPI